MTSFKLEADLRAAIIVESGHQGMATYLRRIVREDLERRGRVPGRMGADGPTVIPTTEVVRATEKVRKSPIPGAHVRSPSRKLGPRLRDRPAHSAWASMRKNSRDTGLPIEPQWENFLVFESNMGPKPAGTMLMRLDQRKGWGPDNCVWGTKTEINSRKSTTGRYTFNGRTQTLPEWARETNINERALRARLRHGWPIEEALGTPVGPGPGKRGRPTIPTPIQEPAAAPSPILGRRRIKPQSTMPLKRRDRRYLPWKGMRERCAKTGDTFVPEWEEFWVFARDLGERPPGTVLLRRDMSVPYGPKNCFWGTKTQANRGRRFVRRYRHDGREMTVAELAEAVGLGYKTLDARLRKGVPLEQALIPEVRPGPGRPRR